MCKYCHQPFNAYIEETGGCMGHGPDEYCYCDSYDIHIRLQCNTLNCVGRYSIVRVPELGDKYSIERFLCDYLKEHPELIEQTEKKVRGMRT